MFRFSFLQVMFLGFQGNIKKGSDIALQEFEHVTSETTCILPLIECYTY